MDASEQVNSFLKNAGWDNTQRDLLPADFSSRRYTRLSRLDNPHQTAFLMEASPQDKPKSFVDLARLLRHIDICAPEIYDADIASGFVLMEDFGNGNFGRLVDEGAKPAPLLRRGLDVLIHLHDHFTLQHASGLNLPIFDADLFADQVLLFLDFYWPYKKGPTADEATRASFRDLWKNLLQEATSGPQTLLLRDYILDNLMDLGARDNGLNTGVLDFQDAGIGPEAYDIISLTERVRRDLSDDALDDLVNTYFWRRKERDKETFMRSCAILSAQRHTRTLGNIARRPAKHVYLPRMENHLRKLLGNEVLLPLKIWFEENEILQ